MKKYAFLFPGQGAQEPGMMKDVCESFPEARTLLDSVSSITGRDMAKLLWETDQAELSRSDNSQLAITSASLMVSEVLKSKGIVPSAAMGFSLGEFPALGISGVLSFEDLIRVVQKRGDIMQRVCEEIASANAGHAPGMSAIIGLPPGRVRRKFKQRQTDGYQRYGRRSCRSRKSVYRSGRAARDQAFGRRPVPLSAHAKSRRRI